VARMMDRFIYLRIGLAFVLGFVGLKMILAKYFPVPTPISLGIILLILAVTIGISMLKTQNLAATEGRK
jgi:tellurite resistance protein TerC